MLPVNHITLRVLGLKKKLDQGLRRWKTMKYMFLISEEYTKQRAEMQTWKMSFNLRGIKKLGKDWESKSLSWRNRNS